MFFRAFFHSSLQLLRGGKRAGAMAQEEAFQLLRGKLGVARMVLGGLPIHSPERIALSRGQANAFLDLFTKTGQELDSDRRAQLQSVALNVQFEAAEAASVLSALANVPPAARARTLSQNFEQLVHYIDKPRWEILESDAPHT